MPTTEPVTSRPVPPATPSASRRSSAAANSSSVPMPMTAPGTAYPKVVSAANPRTTRPPPSLTACPTSTARAQQVAAAIAATTTELVRYSPKRLSTEARPSVARRCTAHPASRPTGTKNPAARVSRQAAVASTAAPAVQPDPGARRPAPRLGEAGPTAHQALAGEHRDREQQHEAGQLHRGAEVVGALPDRVDADRDGAHAEVLHRGEVGEHLHHHQRETRGQRRARERQQHPEERPPTAGPERAGGVARARSPARRTPPGRAGRRRDRASATSPRRSPRACAPTARRRRRAAPALPAAPAPPRRRSRGTRSRGCRPASPGAAPAARRRCRGRGTCTS